MARVLSPAGAEVVARRLRSEGKLLVFTNGCFDLIHPGHIRVLEEAKGMGDVLFVGINSDSSVRRLKGPGRPIMPLWARLRVLEAMRAVDYLVPFWEDTPIRLILAIRPGVLVKGGDWALERIVGAREVASWGGRVVTVPLVSGFSTTDIIKKCKVL